MSLNLRFAVLFFDFYIYVISLRMSTVDSHIVILFV